jgi:hypothetical protein
MRGRVGVGKNMCTRAAPSHHRAGLACAATAAVGTAIFPFEIHAIVRTATRQGGLYAKDGQDRSSDFRLLFATTGASQDTAWCSPLEKGAPHRGGAWVVMGGRMPRSAAFGFGANLKRYESGGTVV